MIWLSEIVFEAGSQVLCPWLYVYLIVCAQYMRVRVLACVCFCVRTHMHKNAEQKRALNDIINPTLIIYAIPHPNDIPHIAVTLPKDPTRGN